MNFILKIVNNTPSRLIKYGSIWLLALNTLSFFDISNITRYKGNLFLEYVTLIIYNILYNNFSSLGITNLWHHI